MKHLQHGAANSDSSASTHPQLGLARAVIDALLEHDLLGVLLSPKHLRIALQNMTMPDTHAPAARAISSDSLACETFHQWMLKLYNGIYIEECRHQSKEALHHDLDKKCAFLLNASECHCDQSEEHNSQVELIWRYRRTCDSLAQRP